ncbi:ubiquitin carboxyl-terminal hydrolase 37-like [Haplochromis burtoni]|uniref:ubiquitin carboxyl-terminal hydrolase 37-like n=1 Tax=Haplochromis burtoni TaxID=8153 RepID=UPI001C2D197A|nr:ubiquitin carboxyl-terminal hydrolase 37-like [Haplochromis burtoni]
MENMRTCKSCGHQSSQQEEFTSLSLDLVPEGSIINMLETYLKEQEIEFRCDCGGTASELKSSFDTLPRVLILHLKRFGFTQTYKIKKVDDPVRLQRDLVVPSNQGGGCYSLVSIIIIMEAQSQDTTSVVLSILRRVSTLHQIAGSPIMTHRCSTQLDLQFVRNSSTRPTCCFTRETSETGNGRKEEGHHHAEKEKTVVPAHHRTLEDKYR